MTWATAQPPGVAAISPTHGQSASAGLDFTCAVLKGYVSLQSQFSISRIASEP